MREVAGRQRPLRRGRGEPLGIKKESRETGDCRRGGEALPKTLPQ